LPSQTNQELSRSRWRNYWPWINVGLTAVLLAGGVWYLSGKIDFADIQQALLVANGRYILLALAAVTLSGTVKTWRWRVLLAPDNEKSIPFTALFWAIWLGQLVNTILPFMRVGEFGRAYALNQQTNFSKMQAISTVVIEKSLDLILLGLTLLLLIPLIALPKTVAQSGIVLAGVALILLLGLGLVATQTAVVLRFSRWILGKFPVTVQHRIFPWIISGLEGLSSLRKSGAIGKLLGLSVLTTLIAISIPLLLFRALSIDSLGSVAAIILNAGITLVSTPPTTPGELGIFEGTVIFLLDQLDFTNGAVAVSYAIIYHIVVLLPKIVWGSIAVSRTKWSWQLQQTKAGFQDKGQ
jgi:uncharacterized protein (TIRG00374 family)